MTCIEADRGPSGQSNALPVDGQDEVAVIDSNAKSGATSGRREFLRVGRMRAALASNCVPTAQDPVADKAVGVNRQFVFHQIGKAMGMSGVGR